MRKDDFRNQLVAASFAALRFGQKYVKNRLSHNLTYVVLLNQSYDGHKTDEEVVFPFDIGKVKSGLNEEEVVDLLWREGRCPVWINISAIGSERKVTLVQLCCCGRYHSDESKMYYYWQGTQPFGIKSPYLRGKWKNGKWVDGQKFKLPGTKKALEDVTAMNEIVLKGLDKNK